ncbi:S8 family serine peptidase [Plantactinospora sp. B5E13]|uniref:S8 family serine peptidase n=1 Tax=Plantactinospora sp. B5E13 TaxID=3153758 RepID=UPI00325EE96C
MHRTAAAFVAAASALLVGIAAQPAAAAPPGADPAAVSPALRAELTDGGTTDFIVYLKDRADLSAAASARDTDARAAGVYRQLTTTASRSQSELRRQLDAKKIRYQAYWIANALKVTGDAALVDTIAADAAVERIEEITHVPLVTPTATTAADAAPQAAEWGVTSVKAPQVWSEYGVRGEGIVVANIDTGVQYDHPALAASYRGNTGGTVEHHYNWFDPTGLCANNTPCDNNGHGTHTMGTMVGDDGAGNQIGVAPAATWIAAKGCEGQFCSNAALLAAGQFVLAPTDLAGNNPRPELHADIVNNSWGGDGGDLWYKQIVDAWVAAGIFPSFANGNAGPGCNTAGSPGDYPNSYAVGGYDINNNIYINSSRGGSGVDGATKPDISGPAVNVRSSIPGNSYAAFTGTSMATPHLSGAVALLWSAAPAVHGDITATRALLDETAIDVDSTGCGGTVDDNNNFGEGRLDAYEAVTLAPRGETGTIVGTVTAADGGTPVAGATVDHGTRSTTTDATGRYQVRVPAGEVELTVSAYGYHSRTATVTVVNGETSTEDFALVSAAAVTVSGTVTDGSGHGWPLYARVQVSGRPGDPVHTNPVTGEYTVEVPANATYTVTTTPVYPAYQTVSTEVTVGDTGATVDVAVPVDAGCTATGYAVDYGDPVVAESLDGTDPPQGWTVVNHTPHGGWSFTDPGSRGNNTGGSGRFAIADSDTAGSGTSLDTELVTRPLDLTGVPNPVLRFNSDYNGFGNGGADVDVSTDGGTTWTNLSRWTTASRRGPVVEELALTGAGGAADVRVRFHYTGSFAWWWQLDNISIVNRACEPVPGGLVVGTTTDRNTGGGVNGVTVASVTDPADTAVSAATPADPALGDGFYWLFTDQVGSQQFTATRGGYQPATRSVTVTADRVTDADHTLTAGRVTLTGTVETTQQYGKSRTATVTVRNTGSAPATVQMLERAGDFSLLGRAGAPLVEHWVKGISPAQTGRPVTGTSPAAAVTAAADTWTNVANLPVNLYDNATATVDDRVYSVGGGTDVGHHTRAWAYDPADGTWDALPNLPTGRARPSAVELGGKLYVFGGWAPGGTPVNTVDVFDPAAGTWSTLPTTNPTPAAAAGTAVADGKVYLVGGCLTNTCAESDKVVVFDAATGTFGQVAGYPHSTSWMSCGGVGGKVYCGGGLSGDTAVTDAWVYDPAGDSWTRLPDLPLDLWGSAYTAASGLLVISGGVTNNSNTITNRSIAYDPVTGAWTDLPNAQLAVYRGAGACGVYKVGGMVQPWTGTPRAEQLAGLDECGNVGDLPWLSANPAEFTLEPGASRTVQVTLTATAEAGVTQPGTLTAGLTAAANTPYTAPEVDVTMLVTPPNNWGKVRGAVTSEPCTGAPAGLKATVRLVNLADPSIGYTIVADSAGAYAYWLPQGRYDVIVAKDGWLPETLRHRVTAGVTETLDFGLAPLVPCGTRATGI